MNGLTVAVAAAEIRDIVAAMVFIATNNDVIGTVSTKIAPRLKCYKNASRLNRYYVPTDNAIDFLFSTLHSEMV